MPNYPTSRLTSLNVEILERILEEQQHLLASHVGDTDGVQKTIEDLRRLLAIYMPQTQTPTSLH